MRKTPVITPHGVIPYLGLAAGFAAVSLTKTTFEEWFSLWFSDASTLFKQIDFFYSFGETIQNWWEQLFHLTGGNQTFIHIGGSWLILMSVYWLTGGLFTLVDLTGRPKFILRQRIQEPGPLTPHPVSLSRLWSVTLQVLYNQTVVSLPVIAALFYLRRWRGFDQSLSLPSPARTILEVAFFVFIEESCFYYGHRLLHTSWLYKHFHKRHHEWTSPIAITALYCHPVEHVCTNIVPTLMGPLLLGSHPATQLFWLVIATPFGVIYHSGYKLPFLLSPEAHDFHHLKYNSNYGLLGFMDRFHGTDVLYRKWITGRNYRLHEREREKKRVKKVHISPNGSKELIPLGTTNSSRPSLENEPEPELPMDDIMSDGSKPVVFHWPFHGIQYSRYMAEQEEDLYYLNNGRIA